MPTTAFIVLDSSTLIVGETTGVTISFSEAVEAVEAVEALEIAGFTVENGAFSALTTADGGTAWTATFTPSATTSDATNVITLADTYADTAGNTGTGASSANCAFDTSIDVGSDAAFLDTDGSINANDMNAAQYTISGVDATSPPRVVRDLLEQQFWCWRRRHIHHRPQPHRLA